MLLLLAAGGAHGQENPPAAPPAAPPATAPVTTPPAAALPAAEEYGPEEFAPWLRDLRRGEIILFGSFPVSLFVCFEVFDLYRFFANDYQIQYAPWPFRPQDAAQYSTGEKTGLLVAAVSVSLLVAGADYLIGRARARRNADRRSQDR
jgi:hypothetical protein